MHAGSGDCYAGSLDLLASRCCKDLEGLLDRGTLTRSQNSDISQPKSAGFRRPVNKVVLGAAHVMVDHAPQQTGIFRFRATCASLKLEGLAAM